MDILKNRFQCLLLIGCLAVSSCVTATSDRAVTTPDIKQMRLGSSNVFLIKSNKFVLIDSGGKNDLPALQAALAAKNVPIEKISTIILTHAHADHAGLAAELRRRSGAVIVMGAGDVPMAKAGHNDDIKPTNLMARILKRFVIDPNYEGFTADVLVDEPLDLQRFGLSGRAVQMPGHTPGSLVVVLDDGRAFVGDIMLGGWMGGAMLSGHAGEHYFQADMARNHANIEELLKQPINTFYLGHGGPVTRESVLEGFNLVDPLGKSKKSASSAQ